MDFTGEHLVPGYLGHFFVVLSLVSSLAAAFSYFKSTQTIVEIEKGQWKKLARVFFLTEVFSVFAIVGTILYINHSHFFEYKYAWQHSSRFLEPKYILSGLWEGQEGSFLLWSIWHCVLGTVVISREREWEAPVMAVLSIAQVCLASMIAGIHFSNFNIGSNPFVLLRNTMEAPIFSQPNYLSFIKDGNDLNPLLQNYWMVIHPPVLFLGFASTIMPFAFAIAGLWTKRYTEWGRAALPWALFSAGILGLGIMMGAAWAYESLNFGGYWAWDPVENASLVPWLVMVAGIHTLLIFRHTGHSLRATHLFFILSFLLILYATYLTRSGDLQDTSVHAFTGEGISNWQLRFYLAIFAIPALALFFSRYKQIPTIVREEQTSSREFWMFIGSLVLFLAAVSIIVMTSIPVFNKVVSFIAGASEPLIKPLAFGEDTAFAYNRIQIFVAIVLGLLTAVTQYLKYKSTHKQFIMQKLLWPTLASVLFAALIFIFGNIDYRDHGIGYLGAVWLAVACSVYAVVANAAYIALGLKGRLKVSGGSITHMGFGLMLVGILISSSKKEILSYNTSGIYIPFDAESKQKPGENLTLVKDLRTDMGKYWVTYKQDSANPNKPLWYFSINFQSKRDSTDQFTLTPDAFVNYKGNTGLMANPDAKHYWDHDLFTYITSLPDPDKTKDTATFKTQSIVVGDTIFYSKGFAVLENIVSKGNIPTGGFAPEDSAAVATIKIYAQSNSIYTIEPLLVKKGSEYISYPDTVTAEDLVIQLQKASGDKAELGIKESDSLLKYVTLKVYKFPFIIVLWLGTVIMVVGFMMSMVRRIQNNRLKLTKI